MDYYLKASSGSDVACSLVNAGLASSASDSVTIASLRPANGVNVDVIGKIVTFDPDGTETALTGFHANLRLDFELTAEQRAALPIITAPLTPYRTWA
jgi:hypothetical protein